MILKSRKAAVYFGMALIIMLMPILPATIAASTSSPEQVKEAKNDVDTVDKQASYIGYTGFTAGADSLKVEKKEKSLFDGKAVSTTDPYVEVKTAPDDSSETAGKLFQYDIADVLEQNTEWTKINSGDLTGYVKTANLCFKEEAEVAARQKAAPSAEVNSDNIPVYITADNNAQVINTVGTETKVSPVNLKGDYTKVDLGDNQSGYILSTNLTVSYGLDNGLTIAQEEEQKAKAQAEEEAKKRAEAEAQKAAKEKEEAQRQKVIKSTQNGSDVTYNSTMQVSDDEIQLMAAIIDWEAGWESYQGKLAVANVILNRVRNPKYANSITGVVYAKGQFSGVLDAAGNVSANFKKRLSSGPRTQECVQAAREALAGKNNIGNYTSFIAVAQANYSAYPNFLVIGGHCFY